MEHQVIDLCHAGRVHGWVHFPVEPDGVGQVVVARDQEKSGRVVAAVTEGDAFQIVLLELLPGVGGALDGNFLPVGDVTGDHDVVDSAYRPAGIDTVVPGQRKCGQMVDLRYETGIDVDGLDAAVAIESRAGNPKVDVGGEDDLDDGLGGVGQGG